MRSPGVAEGAAPVVAGGGPVLRATTEPDPRAGGIPSTEGVL
ncbi:hypothetical protein [Amycolatopsis sp. FDAARGOS 1241]|nr:hypothetical protein [Amycolatopsis sp. FDAARGOS 1241]